MTMAARLWRGDWGLRLGLLQHELAQRCRFRHRQRRLAIHAFIRDLPLLVIAGTQRALLLLVEQLAAACHLLRFRQCWV
jgi:hypothetical protein